MTSLAGLDSEGAVLAQRGPLPTALRAPRGGGVGPSLRTLRGAPASGSPGGEAPPDSP